MAVGELAAYIADGAEQSGVRQVYRCRDKEEAKPILAQLVRPDCAVLLKASRGMKMEELTAYLLSLTEEPKK